MVPRCHLFSTHRRRQAGCAATFFLEAVPTYNIQDHKSLEITAVKLSFVSYLYRGIRPRNPFNESRIIKEVSFRGVLSLTPSGRRIWEEVRTQLPPFLTDPGAWVPRAWLLPGDVTLVASAPA